VLPAGWTKSTRRLARDLVLEPAEAAGNLYHYLVFRDSADNTYHQIGWSNAGSLAAQVAGMPIWGGRDSNVLRGDVGGVRDDLFYGGGGNDTFYPGAGSNTIWGYTGIDTVVLAGRRADYTVAEVSADGSSVTLTGLGSTQVMHHIDFVRFDDGVVGVASLRN
jgi:Ca2+-binding RTX toxin-like protein